MSAADGAGSGSGVWPDPALAIDQALDAKGVCEQTGCDESDYAELTQVFIDEAPPVLQRLHQAEEAVRAAQGEEALAEAAQKVRSAAHELATSFGIVGSRHAEAYARMTDQCVKRRSGEAPPSREELQTAARTLAQAVERVLQLLKAH